MTTDAGLLVMRELDEVPGLTEMASGMLAEARANKRRHDLAGLLRKSVYARLAGDEDVNDQEAFSRDPAVWAVIGRRALKRNAASSATVSRFETEILAAEDKSPAHGQQEGSACNGHFKSVCYPPLTSEATARDFSKRGITPCPGLACPAAASSPTG